MAKKAKKSSSQKSDTIGNLIIETKYMQEKLTEAATDLKHAAVSNNENTQELLNNMGQLIIRLDKIFIMFEEASKHVGDVETAEAKIANLSTKLEALLDQNKTIAQGLVLLEKYIRGKTRLEPAITPKPLE